jgi:oxygen-independent coproporphyrinogen-3 oxidase
MSSLYIHIPFCRSRCGYCTFLSFTADPGTMAGYVDALVAELALIRPLPLRTVYVGGGTPSLLGPRLSRTLLEAVAERFDCGGLRELTVEANPESLDRETLGVWKELGVSRVSLGAQSFHDETLAWWGRPGRVRHIRAALELLHAEGFGNVNLDLVAGLQRGPRPADRFAADLEEAARAGPSHISVYLLEGAAAAGVDVTDREWERMYLHAIGFLARRGYRQYEISNFALPGRESEHNLNYWRGGEYLAAGLGAVSTVGAVRTRNQESLDTYTRLVAGGKRPVQETEILSERTRAVERLMLGLRTTEGVSLEPPGGGDRLREYLRMLQRGGLAVLRGENLALTGRGMFRSNRIISDMIGMVM